MTQTLAQSRQQQKGAEADVEGFRRELGPFVVATETTRMPMVFTDATKPLNPIIFANDSFLTLTEYRREDVLGRAFNSLMAGNVDAATFAKVESAFAGTCNADPEIHYRRKDGSEFWAALFISPVHDEQGEMIQNFISLVDLSAGRRLERELREAVEQFHIVSQATADVVWDWNLLNDLIWWSEGILPLFGYDIGGSVSGSDSWTQRIHPGDRDRVVAGVRSTIDTSKGPWTSEYRFLCADGSAAQVIHRGIVIRDETGKPMRMVGSLTDVTQQRNLEAQLRQTQRMDAIGQLTGGLAHDFNNLLTVILSSAEELEEHLSGHDTLSASAEMIRTAAERGAELTHRLLAFSRKQTLNPKSTDVKALISGMSPLLQRALGDHVQTEAKAEADLWPALIDPPQLESAILNLCINARDAMPDGGRISIEMVNVQIDAADDTHASASAGEYILVAVTDTGAGMDSDTLARVLEPFFTTKDVGKGSGLGLSMVHGFVEQSKGFLKIQSALGKGTCVKLYLPRSPREAQQLDARVAPPVIGGSEKILVVEDNDLVRGVVTSELEALGYRVVSVGEGSQALQLLSQTPDFDLLFTDCMLPGGLDGRQLATEARKLRPSLPVLFTSGYSSRKFDQHHGDDLAEALLQKPYRRRDLAAKVRDILSSVKPAEVNELPQ